MTKVGIISDTHAYWDDKYELYLGECDEIWHAGDIGSVELADRFEAMKPVFRAVYGNCDGYDLRARYREILRFKCEDIPISLRLCPIKASTCSTLTPEQPVCRVGIRSGH